MSVYRTIGPLVLKMLIIKISTDMENNSACKELMKTASDQPSEPWLAHTADTSGLDCMCVLNVKLSFMGTGKTEWTGQI